MTRWSELRHSCGSADDLPALLEDLSPDATDPVWGELWERVCHQGTVYSASAPVLPFLLLTAGRWPPAARVMPLSLAGAIVVAQTISRRDDLTPYRQTIEVLHRLAIETVASAELSPIDFIHLLQALLALEDDQLWGRRLDGLAAGEFEGRCPSCGVNLLLVVGQYGCFVTAGDWVGRNDSARGSIRPRSIADLHSTPKRLHRYAVAAVQEEVAGWALHLFGEGNCPTCGNSIGVAEAIAAGE